MSILWKRAKGMYHFNLKKYQQWVVYPQSPCLTSEYPYQCIMLYDDTESHIKLFASEIELIYYGDFTTEFIVANNVLRNDKSIQYDLVDDIWVYDQESVGGVVFVYDYVPLLQANHNMYMDYTFSELTFAKTTRDWRRVNL